MQSSPVLQGSRTGFVAILALHIILWQQVLFVFEGFKSLLMHSFPRATFHQQSSLTSHYYIVNFILYFTHFHLIFPLCSKFLPKIYAERVSIPHFGNEQIVIEIYNSSACLLDYSIYTTLISRNRLKPPTDGDFSVWKSQQETFLWSSFSVMGNDATFSPCYVLLYTHFIVIHFYLSGFMYTIKACKWKIKKVNIF